MRAGKGRPARAGELEPNAAARRGPGTGAEPTPKGRKTGEYGLMDQRVRHKAVISVLVIRTRVSLSFTRIS